MRKNTICLGCMREKGQEEICPFCGYREGTPAQAPHYLPPGTILAGKYLVGRGLGHGGFGTTYIARDQVLGIKLAIKEYLPQDCASRTPGSNMVTPFSGEGAKRFADGLESFLQEARTLARFDGSPNIVGVRDFFTENGTAYLVMNYLEGITLKQYLVRSGGKPVPFNKMLGILLPVMDALRTVHAAGLLHRDVSPDNIFLTTSGQVTLIDFGAARQSMNLQQSMSVILKPGYAPEEQYRSRGHQGPWTDIYALGATMYRTLTGKIPPEALERLNRDCLIPPSQMGISIPPHAEAAILRAMAVHAQDRFQTIDEFRTALLQGAAAQERQPQRSAVPPAQRRDEDPVTYPLPHKTTKGTTTRQKKKKKGVRPAVVVTTTVLMSLVVVVVLFFVYLSGAIDQGELPGILTLPPAGTQINTPESTVTEEPTAAPEQTQTPEAEPTPTPTPVDPALAPFVEGAAPDRALSSFVPAHGRMLVVENENATVTWVTGQANAYPELLSAQFVYNTELGAPQGEVYGFYMDQSGNLRYASTEEGGSDEVLLPATCTVGTRYSGMLGSCKVYAVNYSGTSNGVELRDCVVVECDAGYAFFQSGKGLVLVQSEFDGGDISYCLLQDEADSQGIFHQFVE